MAFNPDAPSQSLGPCVFAVEYLDLTDYGLPGLSFTGDLHIDIDQSSGEDEWYIECATAATGGAYHVYSYKSSNPLDCAIFRAIDMAVSKDSHLCDCIRDECKEHADG